MLAWFRRRYTARGRLQAFLETKPAGDLLFEDLVKATDASEWDVVMLAGELVNAGALVQLIRVGDAVYPDMLSVPHTASIHHLKLFYRIAPRVDGTTVDFQQENSSVNS